MTSCSPCYANNGNITRYFASSGATVTSYTYYAFGRTISAAGPLADTFSHRFSTKYFDTETELYYYGYRYYSPVLRRFLSPDPLGPAGGVNLYAYAAGDPLSFIDPLGLCASQNTSWWARNTGLIGQYVAIGADVVFNFIVEGVIYNQTFHANGIQDGINQVILDDIGSPLRRLGAYNSEDHIAPSADVVGASYLLGGAAAAAISANKPPSFAVMAESHSTQFPENLGFVGNASWRVLGKGEIIDRFGGSESSRFISVPGTSFQERALPPNVGSDYRQFEVLEPFEVLSGAIAPAYNAPGGGIQFVSPLPLGELIANGYLRELMP